MPKKQKKPKKPNQVWKIYEKKGEAVERKNKTCPKCGPGYYMAKHKDRVTCGHCNYMEKVAAEAKEEKPKKEAPKEEKAEKPAKKEEKK
jgi:small subunit ribosomal protein S27Ae